MSDDAADDSEARLSFYEDQAGWTPRAFLNFGADADHKRS